MHGEDSNIGRNPVLFEKRFLVAAEGHIFVTGSCMLYLWVLTVAVLWRIEYPLWGQILTMGFTQLLAGRAVAIAQATQAALHPLLMVFLATYVDAMVACILYPVLVYSYRNLFEGHFFRRHMQPVFDSAHKALTRFRRYKIASVFLFVWFPFYMTGVIAGSVLGYLLGLRPWITMTTVTLGTLSAAFCWVYAYDVLYRWMGQVHKSIPIVLTILIIAGLAVRRILAARRKP